MRKLSVKKMTQLKHEGNHKRTGKLIQYIMYHIKLIVKSHADEDKRDNQKIVQVNKEIPKITNRANILFTIK